MREEMQRPMRETVQRLMQLAMQRPMRETMQRSAVLASCLLASIVCAPLVGSCLMGCAPLPRTVTAVDGTNDAPPAASPQSEDERTDVARARKSGLRGEVHFLDATPDAFAKAATQGRLVLLDCVATWCHWCHVMDETTYRDPQVRALLDQHFIALRADIDAHPDLMARYESWGWPATVILTPQGEELGKFRGYLAPAQLIESLRAALASRTSGSADSQRAVDRKNGGLIEEPLPVSALSWLGPYLFLRMDSFFDQDAGGWGFRHKRALGGNIEIELRRAARGDRDALTRALNTLKQQRALYDPVWGGVYQYSTRGDWEHPHFEKLLPVQTSNLEALARAFAQTGDRAYLEDALRIDRYLQRFLQDERGAFLVSQDADLGGFEGKGRFVDGHDYFALEDGARRALGIPRVDRSVYAQENGLGIAALCALAAALPDAAQAAAVLARARKAADNILLQSVTFDGAVHRGRGTPQAVRYLADAAALGRGLVLLHGATGDARYLNFARRIGDNLLRSFAVQATDAMPADGSVARDLLWASTKDPAAIGVFARRQQPFDANVQAARFLIGLGDATSRSRAARILAGLSTASRLADQGYVLGEYLLALDDLGSLRFRSTSPVRAKPAPVPPRP